MYKDPKIIVALDLESRQEADAVVNQLDPLLCRLKVGKSLFTTLGPEWVKQVHAAGFETFLDLKFHDIPFQIACSCREAAKLGVWMVNLHALGGLKMLKAGREALDIQYEQTGKRPLLIGVTLLTSHSEVDLVDIGLTGTVEDNVLRLAHLCHKAGLDGVVCSAQEATRIKQELGADFLCITPGIRLLNQTTDDQVRVLTPLAAINAGSDYLVMGRSILAHSNPNQLLKSILESLELKQEIRHELV